MKHLKYLLPLAFLVACNSAETKLETKNNFNEQHRPQIHFTPEAHWMNDPNGMVFYKDEYHLFYQYYPDSTIWGPMHWGHATSKDLVHWEHQPVALYPDSLGYIFSGSAVLDINNTSGLGKDGKPALVAIYTSHDAVGEKAGTNTFQTQSIAYSNDEGKTWAKYEANPVLKNPGVRDFRDPKVSWYEAGKKWIMTLATQDRITFYSSPDLKNWNKESEFGKELGAHGGVWECPDLFSLEYDGKQVWVLLVSINPGGPNGGSATQYFTGNFDGTTFTPNDIKTKWIDYGPDNYAGITWSNTGARKIFLGWMSNWQYANIVPTEKWRSATTVPRDLQIEKVGEEFFVSSHPVKELSALDEKPVTIENTTGTNFNITAEAGKLTGPATLTFGSDKTESFTISLSNDAGEKILIGYDKEVKTYFIDRTNSGKTGFEKGFAKKHIAPRLSDKVGTELKLIIDNASVELFADGGLTVMTAIYFPNSLLSNLTVQTEAGSGIKSLTLTRMKTMYE